MHRAPVKVTPVFVEVGTISLGYCCSFSSVCGTALGKVGTTAAGASAVVVD